MIVSGENGLFAFDMNSITIAVRWKIRFLLFFIVELILYKKWAANINSKTMANNKLGTYDFHLPSSYHFIRNLFVGNFDSCLQIDQIARKCSI